MGDHRSDAGPKHFYRNLRTIMQHCQMDLGNRGAGYGLGVKYQKNFIDWLSIDHLQRLESDIGGERGNAVLQFCQFVGDILWQKIAAGGEHLTELDKNGPQRFQRQAQPFAARFIESSPESGGLDDGPYEPQSFMAQKKFIEAKAK